MIRLILPAMLAFALTGGETLTTQYSVEKAYRIEVECSFSMETVDFSMERDGEPVEGGFGGGGRQSEESRTVVMIDTVLDAKDGKPTQVRRAFESIGGSSTSTRGDRESEYERECPLSGVVIEMTLDDGEVTTEVVEGDEPDDEALLEGHLLALSVDALLPEGEVDADEAWEVDGESVMRAFGIDVEKALFPAPQREESEGEGRGGRRGGWGSRGSGGVARYFTSGDWEAEATLETDTEEYEGVECHVIRLEAEATGELPEREFGGRGGRGGGGGGGGMLQPAGAAPMFENSFEFEVEGKLFFSVEGGHPVHLEIEGKLSTESVREMERRESTMVISNSQEGTFNYTVDIQPVREDGQDE
jgi:hypothetical protein